jgi:sortase (surface protein transpeptidase)
MREAAEVPAPARARSLAGLVAVLLIVLSGARPEPVRGTAAAARPPAGATSEAPASVSADSFTSARTYPAVAPPVRLRIPAIGVDTRLDRLGLQADGTIAVPRRAGVAGWYARGPRPGQPGPAVVLGHVDSRTGPGVFVNLARLGAGDRIRIDRADGTAVTFRVTEVTRVPKARFPTDLVYAPTLDPALRLVTCGGNFDRARRSYRDNVIAFADLV